MKRSPKLENPVRNTVIFLAILGFCCSSSLFSTIFFLSIASLTFSSIIIEISLQLILKKPATANTVSSYNEEQERAALRAQIDQFRTQVGQPTFSSLLYAPSLSAQREKLPAKKDDSRMPSPPKLSCL